MKKRLLSDGNYVNDNTLTVTVKRLREKLNDWEYIISIRGINYGAVTKNIL